MLNEQELQQLNPDNGANITPEVEKRLRSLTDEEIEQLARVYPNQPTRKSYLVLFDTNVAESKQVYPLSTWQNLHNTRKYNNQKNLKPWDFRTRMQARRRPEVVRAAVQTSRKVVVDLSPQEAADLLTKNLREPSGLQQVIPVTSVETVASSHQPMTVLKPDPPQGGQVTITGPNNQTTTSPGEALGRDSSGRFTSSKQFTGAGTQGSPTDAPPQPGQPGQAAATIPGATLPPDEDFSGDESE